MEIPGRTDGKILCGQKTDLNLLLECLKYQMDSPATQKQALITIHSICQQNSEACDYFREIGGVQFVNGLIKLSDAPILREAALFTLGALAESSVYCQQSLCTAELLSDVALSLAQEDASLVLKRMNVYMILVLVSHNKENQRLCAPAFPFAKDCLQKCIRHEVIRPICAFIGLAVASNSYVQDYFCKVGGLDAVAQTLVRLVDESVRHHSSSELAISVVKTLNSCISENPPVVSRLSEYFIVPKLVALLLQNDLDISSKLGIILAIGHCTDGCEAHQYQLLQSNGLPLMIQIVAESQDEEQRKAATFVLQSCQLITEKLSKSLTESVQPSEDTVTTYGIDYSQNNSLKNYWKFAERFLSRIKTLEKQQEESCEPLLKQMPKQREDDRLKHCSEQHSLDNIKMDKWTGETRQAKNQNITPEKRKFDLTHRAVEHREEDSVISAINPSYSRNKENKRHYRDQQLMEKVKRQIFVEDNVPDEVNKSNSNAAQFGNVDALSSDAKAKNMNSQQHDLPIGISINVGQNICPDTQNRNRVLETNQQHGAKFWPVQREKPSYQPRNVPEAEFPRPSTSTKEQRASDKQDFKKSHRVIDNIFKRPAPNSRKKNKQNYKDSLILCSDLIETEINSSLTSPAPSLNAGQDFRCSENLLTPIKKATSYMTNFHTQRTDFLIIPKPSTKDFHTKKILLTPIQKTASQMMNYRRQQTDFITWPKSSTKDIHVKRFLLTPLKKSASVGAAFRLRKDDTIQFKPTMGQGQKYQSDCRGDLCRPQLCNQITLQDCTYAFDDNEHSDICEYILRRRKKKRRKRKNFTEKEVNFLLDGVKKMGYHWNSILWSYPFQKGRTNIDLSRKYRTLRKRNSKTYKDSKE
ncbi:telomere repeats-binding bouquet formation protein 1 [Stegostoma tigrinum]|uniref:telomere repeats-binding bouquet formation protein 1 n=1 Tax=Stegostoma tigrinum TaxID=3053191 RepID=UPI00202B2EBE|nr:telomere repeats-binding bouquet formation protein 1 [Stegostoma tigrinum]